ncbi:MAG TPA: flavoprotein [Thermomicrobiales bacterium]|nr:flavoprotein [Thermomicrobiales bacterium]
MNELTATYLLVTGAGTARRVPGLIAALAPRVPNLLTVLTPHATRVVSPRELALVPGHRVVESYFDEAILPRPPLGVTLVAPCTFNSLNKLALGIADTLALSIAAEAIGRGTPVIVAVSVNDPLWNHPRTAESMATLRTWGVQALDPAPDTSGHLTMAPDPALIEAVLAAHAGWRSER